MQATATGRQLDSATVRSTPRRDILLHLGVLLGGLCLACWLNWPAFQAYGVHKDDLVQSPHWAAYHTTSFRGDDVILLYASFNESPLQNAIYWAGTWFVEVVELSKIYSVVSYGVLSLIFFVVGRAMYGVRFGLLLSLFISVFPDQWEFSSGFFSKFWAIPVLLMCVFILQTDRWKGLIGLLPFAAVAYPSAAVLVGLVVAVYWIQELWRRSGRAAELFRYMAIGSVLAVALLLFKYAPPAEEIGAMRLSAELHRMPELRSGPSNYIPVPPLTENLLEQVSFSFTLIGTVFYFLVLGRRGVGWERAWTALFLASVVGYVLADLLFMHLYIPDRYTRYSMAVLVALWNARNWDLILAQVRSKSSRFALVVAMLIVGGVCYVAAIEPEHDWSDRTKMSPISRFIREELPEGVLIAGSPKRMDDVMLQGKRSVLVPYKLAHPWFTTYYDRIRAATRATLQAHFARNKEPLNSLHRRYGVTHFLVERELLDRVKQQRRVFLDPYNDEIYQRLGGRSEFFLSPAPPGLFIWQDENYALIELPIP